MQGNFYLTVTCLSGSCRGILGGLVVGAILQLPFAAPVVVERKKTAGCFIIIRGCCGRELRGKRNLTTKN